MRDAGAEILSIDASFIFAINVGLDVTINESNAITEPNDSTNATIDAYYEQEEKGWTISKFKQ